MLRLIALAALLTASACATAPTPAPAYNQTPFEACEHDPCITWGGQDKDGNRLGEVNMSCYEMRRHPHSLPPPSTTPVGTTPVE